jgi:uracil-DNA glycosylase
MTDLLIVGDFMSRKDMEEGGIFSDGLGKMLKAFLRERGIDPRSVEFYNVMNDVPSPRATLDQLLGKKTEGIPNMKHIKKGKYVKAEYLPHVEKLWRKVNYLKPNLILALGDLPTWALCKGDNPIDSARGRITEGNSAIGGRKVLPTYNIKQVVADWALRVILFSDLEKAAREMCFPEMRRPQRFLHIAPSLEDMEDFYNEYLVPCTHIASDIETKGTMITCVSFAPTEDRALVVPFYSQQSADGNYWPSAKEEALAWRFVQRCLSMGKVVGGQNYQYDMQYEWREMGIPNPDFGYDTMLLHHVLQPELRKGLGFLASIYTDEIAWKGMHKVSASDRTTKKGDGDE